MPGRFAKKRFLSEATGFDAILVIVIRSVASRAISGTAPFYPVTGRDVRPRARPLANSYITQNSALLGYIVKGKDTVLIRNGEIDREALAASHMSEDDLEEDRACYCESSATLSQMSFDTRVMATLLWLFHVI